MKADHDNKRNVEGGDEKRKAGTNLTKIRGIVIPVGWDKKGNVVAAAILTYDEDEYLINIEKHEKGKELLSLIRKEVEVSGLVREDENSKTITVKKYRLKKGSNLPVISEPKLKDS